MSTPKLPTHAKRGFTLAFDADSENWNEDTWNSIFDSFCRELRQKGLHAMARSERGSIHGAIVGWERAVREQDRDAVRVMLAVRGLKGAEAGDLQDVEYETEGA